MTGGPLSYRQSLSPLILAACLPYLHTLTLLNVEVGRSSRSCSRSSYLQGTNLDDQGDGQVRLSIRSFTDCFY